MNIIQFPSARVIEVNKYILQTTPGFVAQHDQGKLEGALGRIDTAIAYQRLDDVFFIAAKYAAAIGVAHAFSDANKRTGLAICLEYLSLNDFELQDDNDNDKLANAMVGLIVSYLKYLFDFFKNCWCYYKTRMLQVHLGRYRTLNTGLSGVL